MSTTDPARTTATTPNLTASANADECPHCGEFLPLWKCCDCPGAESERRARQAESERRAEQQKQAEKERRLQRRIKDSGIALRFVDGTLNTYDGTHNAKALDTAYTYVQKFGEHAKSGRGIMMSGEVGRGKTRLATTIAMEIIRQGYTARYTTTGGLLDSLKASFKQGDPEGIINDLLGCNLLILDDFGKENVTEWAEERMFHIIDQRYSRCRPLIITTNMGFADIRIRYPWNGAAIVSRLHEMSIGLKLVGPDRRQQ